MQCCYQGLAVRGQGQELIFQGLGHGRGHEKFFKAKAKTLFKVKGKDTKLFQGQLQGQAEIHIATTT